MSTDKKSGGQQQSKSSGSDPSSTPRSGSGADTALEVMIKKRNMGTSGESEPSPAEDTSTHPPSGK
ncbi:MAG: hypothetical protein V4787_04055 [Pseudomonadota bacterium]